MLATSVLWSAMPLLAFGAPNSKALREALIADYPLTKVGVVAFKTDYNRITQPGTILAVRVPGIYADIANTEDAIVNTNVANGQVSQATGFTAAFGSNTGKSRTLKPEEKVYVTDVLVKRDAVQIELLTVDVTTLADGQGTRYRAELNVKLPGLDNMTPEDVKKTIDTGCRRSCSCICCREQNGQTWHEHGRSEEDARQSGQDRGSWSQAGLHL